MEWNKFSAQKIEKNQEKLGGRLLDIMNYKGLTKDKVMVEMIGKLEFILPTTHSGIKALYIVCCCCCYIVSGYIL